MFLFGLGFGEGVSKRKKTLEMAGGAGRFGEERDRQPLFFKVFVPEYSSMRMKIPKGFVDDSMKGEQGNFVNLVVSGGQKWRVGFVVKRKDWYFYKGWKAFLEGNAVYPFDFLVFRYLGSMAFHVTIFGTNGCAKLSASCGDLPKAMGVDAEKRRQNRQKSFKGVQMGSEKRGPGRRHVPTPDEQKVADSFTSIRPFFVKTLAWKSKQSPKMHLAHSSLKQHSITFSHNQRIVLRSLDGYRQPVKISKYPYVCSLYDGLTPFMRHINASDGDVLIFQVLSRFPLEMLVQVADKTT